jgi:hypothetical protein
MEIILLLVYFALAFLLFPRAISWMLNIYVERKYMNLSKKTETKDPTQQD